MSGDAGEGVFGVFVPWEEEEFEVKGGERFADVVHGGQEQLVVDAPFATLMGGFEEQVSVSGDTWEGAGLDFCGTHGVVSSDGSELGDVEHLEGITSIGAANVDGGAVGEGDFFLPECGEGDSIFILLDGEVFLELSAEGCELSVERGGIVGQVVQVLVREGYFAELFFGFREGAVDYASVEIFCEQAGVKDEEGKVGRDAELAHLENVVARVAVAV